MYFRVFSHYEQSFQSPGTMAPSSLVSCWSAFTLIMLFCAQTCLHMCTVQYSWWQYALSWFTKLPIPKKKKPGVPLVFLHCSSACRWTSVEHIHASSWLLLLLSMLLYAFFILEMSTTIFWPAFKLQNLHCTAMFWFKCKCWLNATGAFSLFGFVLSDKVHVCPATVAYTLHSFIPYLSTQEPCPRPLFQADLGTDGEPCLTMARLSSHSSNELDFRVNSSQTQAQAPSFKHP